jgi:hypothetical protein
MKKIIEGRLYNTKTATEIHQWDNGCYGNDFRNCSESLYKTEKGSYFIAGYGGPMSKYAESHGSSTSGGDGLRVISESQAIEWLENHDGTEALEEYFADKIEEG